MPLTRLGVLTPSSNTVLEPLTSAMTAEIDGVTAHFSRFTVTEISSTPGATAQFEIANQLAAARLLADANVHAIVWSGTAASWLGFDQDERLCEAITAETDIPAASAVLGMNDLLEQLGAKRIGLVTPYVDDIQAAIIANYTAAGYACVAERHLGESRNFAFAEVSEDTIAAMVAAVAADKPDAILIMCTNMRGARIAPALEAKHEVTVLDSTSAAVWAGLHAAGRETDALAGWGRLFWVSGR
jgi:maleate isomerase